MKALFASDIHGRLEAAKKLQRAIEAYNPEKIFLLGDYLYNGPRNGVPADYDPMAVCEILNRYADRIIGIRGNCDSRIDETLLRFKMSDGKLVSINGYRFQLFHGDLAPGEFLSPQRGDILAFGHTHVYELHENDGMVYFNPGSTSFPKNGNPATIGTMEGSQIEIRDLETLMPIAQLKLK